MNHIVQCATYIVHPCTHSVVHSAPSTQCINMDPATLGMFPECLLLLLLLLLLFLLLFLLLLLPSIPYSLSLLPFSILPQTTWKLT